MAVDISSRENIDESCKKIKELVGPISIIVNNAGICFIKNFLSMSNQQVERTFQINLMSHLWILRQFLPDMVARNHGRIVNVCSFRGLRANHNALPYYSSKFGVNGYSEALKMELQKSQVDGIHVTTVYPYFVKTPLMGSLEFNKNLFSMLLRPLMGFLQTEEVGRKTVDGMRREYEYIHLPCHMYSVMFLENFIPLKFRRAINSGLFNLFEYRDEEEKQGITVPFNKLERCNRNA